MATLVGPWEGLLELGYNHLTHPIFEIADNDCFIFMNCGRIRALPANVTCICVGSIIYVEYKI